MTFGIIDAGTNSIHLVVGILGLNGTFHVLLKERDLTRLGQGGLVRGRLTKRAMRRAERVLKGYAATLRRLGADHVEAVATSAVREAANGWEFARRVRKRLGLPLRVISGREEARLIYLGVLQSARFMRSTMIVSLGGGSVQIMIGDHRRLHYAVSRPLGCARLAERFIRHDPAQREEIKALEAELRSTWAPIAKAARRHRWHETLGSSAMIEQILTAADAFAHQRTSKSARGRPVSQAALRRLVQWLATSKASDRVRLPGLDPRRQDLALTTGMALLTWMEAAGVARIRHAPGSLREGLVVDYLIRHHQRRSRRAFDSVIDVIGTNGANGQAAGGRRMLGERLAILRKESHQ